ncbi:MAG TPA: DAK2 domain-containing protein [Candidatus Limnocylindrales bacterium]|nr:DAK2 domain-containing protein [Candidatus Limnocylindrales bacterium]
MSDFTELLARVATELPAHRDELNRLDGVAGDGDLGLTVTMACRALLELAPSLESMTEVAAIRAAGMEIAKKAPSTGGTLIAFALMGAAKAQVDPGASGVLRAATYLEAAAATIAQRGQVASGDRTMLDALEPAARALRTAADAGDGASEAAAAGAKAADDGATATASMAAKVGRAGWLADRAAGNEDAGARLIALAVAAAAMGVSSGR